MALARRDDQHHTYGDYLGWTEEARYELVDGTAYLMAPAPDVIHQEVAGRIYAQFVRLLGDGPCRAFIAPLDVRLPKGDEDDAEIDTVVQPDVFIVCDPTRIGRRGVRGAPTIVIEVLSPATAGHDQVRKRRVYERAGVLEYWLVHPVDRVVTIYRLEGDEFGKPRVQELAGHTETIAPPGVAIDWDAIVERLPAPEP